MSLEGQRPEKSYLNQKNTMALLESKHCEKCTSLGALFCLWIKEFL
jgi:hypothetical protein